MELGKVTFGNGNDAYAVPSDFCRIFAKDMNRFYRLAHLLTGDGEKAEQCLVSGLEDCRGSNRVFKEWAESWARRAVVQNAIRMIRPVPEVDRSTPGTTPASGNGDVASHSNDEQELFAVTRLGSFERFVFVLSVLEHYSDQECAALLGCARRDVATGRNRALEQIAESRMTHMTYTNRELTDFSGFEAGLAGAA